MLTPVVVGESLCYSLDRLIHLLVSSNYMVLYLGGQQSYKCPPLLWTFCCSSMGMSWKVYPCTMFSSIAAVLLFATPVVCYAPLTVLMQDELVSAHGSSMLTSSIVAGMGGITAALVLCITDPSDRKLCTGGMSPPPWFWQCSCIHSVLNICHMGTLGSLFMSSVTAWQNSAQLTIRGIHMLKDTENLNIRMILL